MLWSFMESTVPQTADSSPSYHQLRPLCQVSHACQLRVLLAVQVCLQLGRVQRHHELVQSAATGHSCQACG